jgi:hypothetical protein
MPIVWMLKFKDIDSKLEDIGFKQTYLSRTICTYQRFIPSHKYTQYVDIVYKNNLKTFIILSYDKDLFDERKIGNMCVGLTKYELKLFQKKMQHMSAEYRKGLP